MPRERLQGLLLIVAGCLSLVLIALAQQHGFPSPAPPAMPASPGPGSLPPPNPLSCLLGLAAFGAIGLCLVGLRKLLWPDDWVPPKHLG